MKEIHSETNVLASRSLKRLRPRLESYFQDYARQDPHDWMIFVRRLEKHFPRLFDLLFRLYGTQYDFFYHLEALLISLGEAWVQRPFELKALDETRESNPNWFLSNQVLGGVCYVDLFAGTLEGIRRRIPYFKELGLTYLYLMPLFRSPLGENDGGYAISSYREVNPQLGSMEELAALATDLRHHGISLVLDFVFNHTSNEHEWALQAQAGDLEYQEYYRMFPDRAMPDAYERHLREIFPEEHPGSFTYFPDIGRWVWTTFHSYQWDLNYQNPAVFVAMVKEMLALANIGVEILRLDAVAFIWKKLGTNCENLPEAHWLIRAFNAVTRIVAPGVLFKSEAIVHPDEVARYIHPDECQLSYNPLLMALLWEALATREIRLLAVSMRERFRIPDGCAWVNYVRCHDDIGWTFSDEDAQRIGINGFDHRQFLNAFYTGRFPGSFARGLPFQENLRTGDCRISGSCASLAGLEKALNEETEREVDLAIRRILLLHGVILTIGGIPLIYLGDEIGILNDYSFRNGPAKLKDSRWVHRPVADWSKFERRHDANSLEGRIYNGLQRLIELRKNNSVFNGQEFQVLETENPHVFGYLRSFQGKRALMFANFSEQSQRLSGNLLRLYGLGFHFIELLSGTKVSTADFILQPYQLAAFMPDES